MKPETSESLLIQSLYEKFFQESLGKDSAIEKLTGDASTRRYYRIYKDQNNSLVACLDTPRSNEFDFVTIQEEMTSAKVKVPRVLGSLPKKGCVFQEDLGDMTFLSFLSQCSLAEELEHYRKIIDELVKIHLVIPENDSPIADRFFDYEKLKEECDITNRFLIEGFFGIDKSSSSYGKLKELIDQLLQRISITEEGVVCHRDFHSRNIMMKNKADISIIDFQDARMGLPQYDLCSLLEDSYYSLNKDNHYLLLKYYFEHASNMGLKLGEFSNFLNVYGEVAFQRTYKALGTFTRIYLQRGDARYLKYVGVAFENLKRVLINYTNEIELRQILLKFYYDS